MIPENILLHMCNEYRNDSMIRTHIFFVFCAFSLLVSASMVTGAVSQNTILYNNSSDSSEIPGSGQMSFDSVVIVCGEGRATVHVTYSLTDVPRFLFLVFGSSSLERIIMETLGFTDARVVSVGAEEADLILHDVATVYGDGVYWLPAHTFQTVIPTVQIITPQEVVAYHDTMEISGIAYYAPKDSL
jgi:hypothetical protein